MAHFFMSMSGSKIREQVAHFLVDIHRQKGALTQAPLVGFKKSG